MKLNSLLFRISGGFGKISSMPVKKLILYIIGLLALVAVVAHLYSLTVTKNDSVFNNLLNKIPQNKSLKIPILIYHYVEYNTDERDFLRDSLNIPPHIFEAQLVTLKDAGYTFITPKDLPELLSKTPLTEQKYVIISFDDGYEDFYTDAFPILQKHNVPAVNYIVFNFIDTLNYLKDEQISELVKSELIEIGSHTLNHAGLTDNTLEAGKLEIELSKQYLEERYGVEVESFAYPYGFYNPQVSQMVKDAGYSNAVTIDAGNVVNASELFEIKRVRPGHNVGDDLLFVIEQDY